MKTTNDYQLIKKSEFRFFKTIAEKISDAIYFKDLNGIYIFSNKKFIDIINKEPNPNDVFDIIGKNATNIFLPNEADTIKEEDLYVLTTKKTASYEKTITSRGGQKRLVISTKGPVFDTEKNIVGIFGIVHDITEQKKAAKTIHEKENIFYNFFNLSLIGICVTSPTKGWIEVNDFFCSLLDYDRDTLASKSWGDLTHPDDLNLDYDQLTRINRGEMDSYHQEKRLLRRNGEILNTEMTVKCLRKKDNSIDYFITTIQDITLKKKDEERIIAAQKLEFLGTWTAAIAHKFNNFLCGIFGFIDLAQKKLVTNDYTNVTDFLTQAMTLYEKAKSLADQLFIFSSNNTPDVVITHQSLATIIKDSIEFTFYDTHINSQITIPENLFFCAIKQDHINQIMTNVFSYIKQSIKTDEDIIVNVSAHNVTERDNYVCVTIANKNIFLPPQKTRNLFDPYFVDKKQGGDFALTIAHLILSKYGGKIDVKSQKNDGTTFFIYFPFFPTHTLENGQSTPLEKDVSIDPFFPKNVLVLDDEEIMRNLYSEYFKMLNCTITTTANGNETFTVFSEKLHTTEAFDLVVLDLTVPFGMGGLQTLTQIRKIDPTIIVFAASGHTRDEIMSHPSQFGFNDSLLKPFNFDTLQNTIHKNLNLWRLRWTPVTPQSDN